jgi:hypothetical protein
MDGSASLENARSELQKIERELDTLLNFDPEGRRGGQDQRQDGPA